MAHLFPVIVIKFVNETIRYLLVLVLSFAIIVCMAAHTVILYPYQSKLAEVQDQYLSCYTHSRTDYRLSLVHHSHTIKALQFDAWSDDAALQIMR